ncbi:MAG: hypothetical protein ACFFG0_05125 [Candidatus Thorarchaeota archaeon]
MKPNVIIVDDIDIEKIKEAINGRYSQGSMLKNNCNIFECDKVEKGTEKSTLVNLVSDFQKNKNFFDFAFIDLEFADEYIGYPLEEGGRRAYQIIKNAFPFCQIIFATNNRDFEDDPKFILNTGCLAMRKPRGEKGEKAAIKRINQLVQEWVYFKCLEINESENIARQKIIDCINNDKIGWENSLIINGNEWQFKDLFFFYKDKSIDEIKEKLLPYIFRFPEIKKDRWEQVPEISNFKSPIKHYYFKFYLEYYSLLSEKIEPQAIELTNQLKQFIEEYLSNNDEEKIRHNLNRYFIDFFSKNQFDQISFKVESIDNGYASIQVFVQKLIMRLVFLTGYIFLLLSPRSLYHLFQHFKVNANTNKFKDDNVRQITNYIFLYNLKISEHKETDKLFFENNIELENDKSRDFLPWKRNYQILLNSCSSDEIRFLQYYYKKYFKDSLKQETSSYFEENIKTIEDLKIENLLSEKIKFIS